MDDCGVDNLLYINIEDDLCEFDKQLLEIYMYNIGLIFEKLNLLVDLWEILKELVYNLVNVVEVWSREIGVYVQ